MVLNLQQRKAINNGVLNFGQALKQINNSRADYNNTLANGPINPFSNLLNSRINFHGEMDDTMNILSPMSPLQPQSNPSSFTIGFKPQPLWLPQNDFAVQAHELGRKVPYAPGSTIMPMKMEHPQPLLFDTSIKAPTSAEMSSLKEKVSAATPKPKGQALAKIGKIAGTAMGVAQGAMGLWLMGNSIDQASRARINPEEMLMKYGTSDTNIGDGISYERQNNIDTASEMDLVKAETNLATMGMAMTGMSTGASVGSIFGPVGGAIGGAIGGIAGAIGGLFGGSSRRKKEEERLRRANLLANAVTNENRQRAFTERMQKLLANKYGNLEDQLLYAQEGVENVGNLFGRISKKDFVDTAFGKVLGEPNAMTSKGELIVHEKSNNGYNKNFNVHEVKRGPNDTAPSYLADNDTVIAEPLVDYAKEAIRRDRQGVGNNEFEKVKIMLRNLRDSGILAMLNRMPRRTTGDLKRMQRQLLPGYFLGKDWFGKAKNTLKTIGNEVYNAIPAITGIGIGLQQYNQAANQDVYKPYSFKSNEYKGALNELDKLHINQFPVTNEIRNAQARTDRAITLSGGLSTGLRATNTIAAAFNTQNAIANALTKLQEINNNYRSQAAQARLNVGAQEAQRKQQAMQWDADTYAKGHAARLQGMQMGLYNIQNALEQHFANTFKRNLFNKTMNLYNQELGLKADEIKKMYDNKNVPESIRRPEDYAYHVYLDNNLEVTPEKTPEPVKSTLIAPSVNLRRGMRNNADVLNLQKALNRIYKNDKSFTPLVLDGSFGNNTYNAVKRFLMDNFANNPKWHTGFYGANTRSKLAEILKSLGGV